MALSLCIPAYNEEKNIHYPLDSAYDLADEVIVIDAGSTDRTAEIALSYGPKVKVFKTDNPRNFLFNKQRAIEKARGEWILQLDADEALSEELKKEILNLLRVQSSKCKVQSFSSKLKDSKRKTFEVKEERSDGKTSEVNENKIAGYWIPRKNWFLSRFLMKGGVYPDYVLRLYKRKNAVFDLQNLHENVKIIIQGRTSAVKGGSTEGGGGTAEVEERIGYLKHPILHYADPTFSRYLLRWDRYTTFDAEGLHQKLKTQNSKLKTFLLFLEYFIWKPKITFLSMYFRHKGFLDGFPGFVFALFSSIRFWVIYIKWWQLSQKKV